MTTPTHSFSRSSEQGFTLVELSIVLVIIGLIVGGVLVGQDLIRAAEVRATVGQVEKYNSALNTFRTRFNAMPGDISNVAATNFGLAARTGAAGEGDANGLIEGSAAGAMVADGEVNLFWNDMTFANLVEGNFTGTNAPATTAAAAPVANFMPPARVGRGNHIAVYANGGLNFYQVSGVTAIAAGVYTMTANLTPTEAFNMDNKIDDGLPTTGVAQSRGGAVMNAAATAGAGGAAAAFCNNTTPAPIVYNTLNEAPLCMLRFRFN